MTQEEKVVSKGIVKQNTPVEDNLFKVYAAATRLYGCIAMSDLINGCLELFGALLLAYNCLLLHQHKKIQGVSVMTTAFFTMWGAWNLYFYPANNLWMSFAGGLCLAVANLAWILMAIYYVRNPKSSSIPLPTMAPPKPASVLDRIYAIRGISTVSHPDTEENRRREATLREACYRTFSVETRPWVTNVLNVEGCRRLMAEHRRKQAEQAKETGSSSIFDTTFSSQSTSSSLRQTYI